MEFVSFWQGSLIAVAILLFFKLVSLVTHKASPSSNIPGPKGLPLVGNVLDIDMTKPPFLSFHEIAKKYGGIAKIQLAHKHLVIVSDPGTDTCLISSRLYTPDINYCKG